MFALLQLTGVLGLVAGGGDDTDHGAGLDGDADADHDVDGGHDTAGHANEQDHDSGGEDRSWVGLTLAPLGFGKIPFSVIWLTYALAFAATGYGLNFRFLGTSSPPVHTLWWTVPAGVGVGYLAVAVVARLLGPMLSSEGQEATSRSALVGQTGVVISSKVDAEFGEIRIRDKTGHDLRVVCKLARGAKTIPRERRQVVVIDYDEGKGELFVEPLDLEEDSVKSSGERG
jgi:hypothetical protein